MNSRVRFLSSILVITLAILLAAPSFAYAQVRFASSGHIGQDDGDCVAEIMEAVMEATGIEDEDELIAYVDELDDAEIEALLEESGVAELAETCELDMDDSDEDEVSCEELIYDVLAIVTEIEDEDDLDAYLEALDEDELDALYEEAAMVLVQAALMEVTEIEDVDELEAYLDELEEDELETLFEESGLAELEEACANESDLEDLPEECQLAAFEVLVEVTEIEDEDELMAYLEELDEDELDNLLDESGVYDIIESCDIETEADASDS